jgi:hypothetical protein|tara:strand:- start:990 stop:1358 length:369 start_codon:yes stop_codon:yes gene_type:complete
MIETYMITGEYPPHEQRETFREDLKVLGFYDTRKESEKALQEFEDLNYSLLKIVHTVPEPVKKAIDKVMDYLWVDEGKDYSASFDEHEEDDLGYHIFESLVVLENFTYDNEKTPKEIIDEHF